MKDLPDHKISVAIADDHALFRKGLIGLLEDIEFIGNIYEASNGKELLDLLSETSPLPDMVLLDLRMPVMDGVEATERIQELFPSVKIIILTMQDDEGMILHLIEKGINSFLLKNVEPDELEMVISRLRERDYYFNEKLSSLVVKAIHSKGKKLPVMYSEDLFSERELEILRLICEEYTAAEIAEKLCVSKRTVDGHRYTLLEKSGARNVVGLVIYAVRNGLYNI
jgi:DNA-binding NarL/FixJ family response regulator